MKPEDAVVFTDGLLAIDFAKTCHGLLRGGDRFNVLAVIDHEHAGADAGTVMDGRPLGIRVYASLQGYLVGAESRPKHFVVGVAISGGRLPDSCRAEIRTALLNGMTVTCGLHQFLGDDPEFVRLARENGACIIDIRRPRPTKDLHFWTGEVYDVKATVIASLGTDCAVGKRTTARFLMEACNEAGIRAELIYTGQTGWMQGYRHGFIFDATPNDFVSGEIERVIVECDRESKPELILLEGQGSLRNPSGPCGSEFLLSGDARGVILQHAPYRDYFVDLEEVGSRIPSVQDEIELIRHIGSETLAVTLNEEGWDEAKMHAYQQELERELSIPVVQPLRDGVESLIPVIREFIDR